MSSIFKPKGKRKYVIMYVAENGKRRKKIGTTDKGVTQRIANDLENKVALRKQGLLDCKAEAYRDHENKPLSVHFAAWQESLETKGNTTKHVELSTVRVHRIAALIMGAKLAEIEPDRKHGSRVADLSRWLDKAHLSDLMSERVDKALADLLAGGRSLGTCDSYRIAVRSFSKWCYDTKRTREDEIRGIRTFNDNLDRRHDRRTISLEELRRLIEVTERGMSFRGITGPLRALCYRLAVATGLRYSEIASIKPESFDWFAPSVTVPACYTKNRDPATFRLPAELVGDLQAHVARILPGEPVFPLPKGLGAKMLCVDLKAAGIPYRDAAGLVFDFHSLRCELATLADAAGVSPRVVQKMMRHSTLELTGRYTRPRLVDIEAASSMLPSLKPPVTPQSERAIMTRTDSTRIATQNATQGNSYGRNSQSSKGVRSNS